MQCVQVIHTNCTVAAIKLSCTHLAIGSFNAEAGLWTRTGELLGMYVGHTSAVLAVDFNVSWDVFVTGSDDETAMLWSLADRTPLRLVKMLSKLTSVHLIFPSDIPRESSIFMLVTSGTERCVTLLVKRFVTDNNEQCILWPVRFFDGNIVWCGNELSPESRWAADVTGTEFATQWSVGADVICSKKTNSRLYAAC